MPPMAQEGIKRRPIGLKETRTSLLRRCVRLSFASAHHERPMCRVERGSSFLQRSRYRFHGLRFLSLAAFAYRMPAKLREADLRGKKIKSTRFPLVRNPVKLREFFANS